MSQPTIPSLTIVTYRECGAYRARVEEAGAVLHRTPFCARPERACELANEWADRLNDARRALVCGGPRSAS